MALDIGQISEGFGRRNGKLDPDECDNVKLPRSSIAKCE